MPFILQYMEPDDIIEVAGIEHLCFTMPWPTSAYRRELKTPDTNRYIVARFLSPAPGDKNASSGQSISSLVHPELNPPPDAKTNGHSAPFDARSLLSSFLPWLRKSANGATHAAEGNIAPVIGYAGLWLMVDEAHVTTIGVHPDYRGQGVGELLFLGLVDIAQEMKASRITLEVRVSNTAAQALYRKYGLEVAGIRKRYYSDNGEDAYIMWSEVIGSPQFHARIARLRAELEARLNRSYYGPQEPSRPVEKGRLQ